MWSPERRPCGHVVLKDPTSKKQWLNRLGLVLCHFPGSGAFLLSRTEPRKLLLPSQRNAHLHRPHGLYQGLGNVGQGGNKGKQWVAAGGFVSVGSCFLILPERVSEAWLF